MRAVQSLAHFHDPQIVAAWINQLETDDDESVRVSAASALGTISAPDAYASLFRGLAKESDEDVREAIQGSLARFKRSIVP